LSANLTVIVNDWGKLQAFNQYVQSVGPSALTWSLSTTNTLVQNSLPGFKTSIMQMLMPVNYQIYVVCVPNNTPIAGISSLAQWIQPAATAGHYNKYWVASWNEWGAYPGEQPMNDIWSSGVQPSDFWLGLNGWSLPVVYPSTSIDDQSTVSTLNWRAAKEVCVTITNNTPNPLTIGFTASEGDVYQSSLTIQPYESGVGRGGYDGGLQLNVTISDPYEGVVASFTASMGAVVFSGADPKVSNQKSVQNYSLTTPILNSGNLLPIQYGAAFQITVNWVSN